MSSNSAKRFDWSVFPGCLMLITFVIGALAVAPAFFQGDERLIARASRIAGTDAGALEGVAVPGYAAGVSYEAGKSIKGLWGSDDLALTVVEPGTGATVGTLDLSQPKDWGGSIMVVGDSPEKTAIVSGELTLPASVPPGEYEGALTGTVELPQTTTGDQYDIQRVAVNVPLRLTVMAAADAAATERATSRSTVTGAGVLTVVFFGLTGIAVKRNKRG